MSAKSNPAFVDSNVLVYSFDRSEVDRQSIAQELISRLLDEDRLRMSTQVLKEFYVTVTRKIAEPLSVHEAIAVLDDLAAWPVLSLDARMIRDAAFLADEATLSFWDGLILIAAQRSGCQVVYTEDLNHGQMIGGVEVVNPFRNR